MPNEVNYLFEIDSEEINKMKKTIIENKNKLWKIVIFVIVLYVYINIKYQYKFIFNFIIGN